VESSSKKTSGQSLRLHFGSDATGNHSSSFVSAAKGVKYECPFNAGGSSCLRSASSAAVAAAAACIADGCRGISVSDGGGQRQCSTGVGRHGGVSGNVHQEQHQSWLMSAHSRAMSAAMSGPEPADGLYLHAASGRQYQSKQRDGELWQY
jgi:hypothetical protein